MHPATRGGPTEPRWTPSPDIVDDLQRALLFPTLSASLGPCFSSSARASPSVGRRGFRRRLFRLLRLPALRRSLGCPLCPDLRVGDADVAIVSSWFALVPLRDCAGAASSFRVQVFDFRRLDIERPRA